MGLREAVVSLEVGGTDAGSYTMGEELVFKVVELLVRCSIL
jgi:hypothetical protein